MPGLISKKSIDEVSDKTDIVELVSEYVPLEQRGADWWGCCPFHNEKTPSFSVSPSKKFYYCFGCGVSGSVFDFVKEMEKISFAEAVELLAKKSGVVLSYADGMSRRDEPASSLKTEYKTLYTRVAGMFHYMLMETSAGKFALDYAMQRGLSAETLEKFKIGYSPADRKWLRKFLQKKNYSDKFLDGSGLFSRNYPDCAFFSDRLMFPIFDKDGDVVAMGGRFLRGDPQKSPKYLNSGDLPQYKKGSTLYAFNFAKPAIREKRKVVFCEGYMDCIAYHQCGINWAVAPLGTALTNEQISLVKNFVEEIYLSFDSDGAGQKATRKAILMCRSQGIAVKVIRLSGGKDPAEIMLKFGPEYLTNEVNNAIFDSDYLLSKLQELCPRDTPMGKTRASLDFFEYIDSLQSDVQKDACLDQLCQVYGIEKEAARKDYFNRNKLAHRFRNVITEQKNQAASEKIKVTAELQAVMTAVTEDVSLFQKMCGLVSADDLSDSYSKQLFSVMQECQKSGSFSVSNILNRIEQEEFRRLIIEYISKNNGRIQESVDSCIQYLRKNALKRRRTSVMEQMVSLSRSVLPEDKALLSELAKQKMELDFQIENLKD
ncbi:DNA primase [Treponema sp.]|uniref:DNA primase n=1 Tax=Treponema sp. TaxID=166 RepID=UPI003F03236F